MRYLLICLLSIVLLSCGSSDSGYSTSPTPTPVAVPSWTTVANLIASNCGGCHNGTIQPAFTSGAQFKASQAKSFLTSGVMPKAPATISAADKATLLAYLQ